jgi:hypothetical protein
LNERPGFRHGLPRRRALTRGQTDDRVTDTPRFAGLHFKIPGFAVALVEEGYGGNALGHGRCIAAAGDLHRRANRSAGCGTGLNLRLAALRQAITELRPAEYARSDKRGDQNDDGDDSPARHASGVHAS